MPVSPTKFRFSFLWLATFCAVGFYIRTASYRNFLNGEGGFWFYSPDPYDHLRRITLGVHAFPSVPSFDAYAAYPAGLGQIWSPLFDYLLSLVAVLFGGSDNVIQIIGFLANPFWSVVTIITLFFVARRALHSDLAGLVAALLLALFPGHIAYTLAAKLDHHVFEPLAILLLFSLSFLGDGRRRPLTTVKILAAACFPLTLLMWRGATLFWGFAFIYLFLRAGEEYRRGNRDFLETAVQVLLGGAILTALLCLVNPWGGSSGLSFNIVSWFHVVVLVGFSALLAILGTSRTLAVAAKRAGFLALAGGVALLLPQVRLFAQQVLAGFSFIAGSSDPWLSSIPEQQTVFYQGFVAALRGAMTLFWLLVPVAVGLAAREWWKGDRVNPDLLALIVWCGGMFFLIRLRYIGVMAIPVALATGYLVDRSWKKWPTWKPRLILGGVVLGLLAFNGQGYRESLAFSNSRLVREGEYGKAGVFAWLRDNTPPTSHYLQPRAVPEYGILAHWTLGSKIYYLAQRPSISTAFGWEAPGLYESSGFLVTTRPDLALELARKYNVRYVLINRDRDFEHLFDLARDGEQKGVLPAGITERHDPDLSILRHLLYRDGSGYDVAGRFVEALENYRLVYEIDQTFAAPSGRISYYKIFEVVSGAQLAGICSPHAVVRGEQALKTSTGRLMTFSAATVADDHGKFTFRVPYASNQRQGGTVTLGNASISCAGGRALSIAIPEETVLTGARLALGDLR